MPWIQNVSLADVRYGDHYSPGENSMLIQIVDPAMEFPVPDYNFKKVYQYEFLDIESDSITTLDDGRTIDMGEFAITDDQARSLVCVLHEAMTANMNVIVHCVAGVCRSGAVAEVAVMMGFIDAKAYRQPNLLVKHKMMKVLGWTYD